ncbi:LysR family transcriptional regulator [Leptolyngbya sp. NK1-12]|uniref:LysR family transcriptional regulator n=1 Tax=Leptolyngbya sp. NK1-12 TaxID=2547451 RepID=A0AA96WQ00_9CYAN|nr:LysR family transcriptional regulator [Leptolyngbya sp. NK1-12]
MTLDQLRVFLTVVHHLHFTRAAEELGLTQPAVSSAIHCLEAEYDVRLFHRIGRQIELTEAGELLQVEAQKLLDHVALIERGLREFNSLQQGELKLGASSMIGNYWLPAKISQFKRQHPNISVKSTLGDSDAICEGVALGLLDLGLITGLVQPKFKQLQHMIVGHERLQIVVGQSHPWFQRSTILLSELLHSGWIMQESHSTLQQVFEATLQVWEIPPEKLKVLMVVSSSEMVKAALEDGMGAAVLPESMIKKEIQLKILRAVRVMPRKEAKKPLEIVLPILQIKHAQRFQTQAALAFEKMLEAQT